MNQINNFANTRIEVFHHLIYWFLFSFGLAVLPLLCNFFFSHLAGTPSESVLNTLSPGGELLLVSTAIIGDAVGSLATSKTQTKKLKLLKGLVAGICLLILVLSCLLFSAIASLIYFDGFSLSSEIYDRMDEMIAHANKIIYPAFVSSFSGKTIAFLSK